MQSTYTLHDYDHKFDAGLALMWNESDEQWPGTFNNGTPMTEETVSKWMDRVDVIMRMIVVEDDTGKVVGYGDLWDTAVRPNSCYVALLNVHPEHQGNSLARRMLVRMVDWAVEHGYDRVTIGTWPANLKAMPLYKKVGFFWVPDTSVLMENYLPGARLLPAAKDFFDRHDWYRDYARDLAQVEDDMTHPCTGKAKVFILRWQAGDDVLETVYDRNAQALTGIETNDWAAYARTDESEPAQGMPHDFEWEFNNKSDRPIEISLAADPDEGIEIAFRENFRLAPGEHRVLKTRFRVAGDAPKYRGDHEDLPTPRIRTKLEIDGIPVEFGTGLRYKEAVGFSIHPPVVTLLPGVERTVTVQLENNLDAVLRGRLKLAVPDGLTVASFDAGFEAGEKGYAGFPLTVKAESEGFYALSVSAEIEDGARVIATGAKRLPVAAVSPGGWAAGEAEDSLVLENDFFRVTAMKKAGEAVIWNKDLGKEDARFMEELGPPFVPWDLNEKEYDLKLVQTEREARAVMTVQSGRFPGVEFVREIVVNASPLIRIEGRAVNTGETAYPDNQVRPHVRIWSENRRLLTLPLKDRLVQEEGSQYGIAEDDFPKQPEGYAEDWVSYSQDGRVIGVIWVRAAMKELDTGWGRFFFYTDRPLAPGATAEAAPYWIYAGPGDWRAVRQTWRRLNGDDGTMHPAPARYLDAGFEGAPLATLDPAFEARFDVRTTRKYRLTGEVEVAAPQGWAIEPASEPFSISAGEPARQAFRFRAAGGAAPGIATGTATFRSQAFDREIPFHVIRLGDVSQSVQVRTVEKAGYETWRIENGHSRWTVVPGFHAGVTTWELGDSDTNHLFTTFPDPGELSWLKPIFGGIRPILSRSEGGEGWPGKLHGESFSVAEVRVEDARGLAWQGLRLVAEVAWKRFRGLQVRLDYLTLPGSNVLKCVYRLGNPDPVYRPAMHGWVAFPALDGSFANAVLHTSSYVRKRTPHDAWGVQQVWCAVENPDNGRTFTAVHASGHRRLQAMDLGEAGAHISVRESAHVPPGGALERVGYFVISDDPDQGRAYAALADYETSQSAGVSH